jgi:pimeloyl-ACP methyl ester carboxylesterase
MARFVLVHGAFHGAWCWEPLAAELRSAGHDVDAIDLPGSGHDTTPVANVTLDSYANRICQALGDRPGRAVLVGHSMAGVAITQAAERCADRIAQLVYVAAFLPHDGQSLVDLAGLPEGADDQVQANMVVEGEPPVATMPSSAAPDAFYGSCTAEQIAWAMERIGPQPIVPFVTPVDLDGAAAAIPRSYVICSRDRALPPALQRRMSQESDCAQVVEIDTDHSPFLSATSELAATLDRFGANGA